MGIPSFAGRVGLAGGAHAHAAKRSIEERATCNLANGDLYVYPNSTSTIDATKPVTFQWNTACSVASSTIDLYLYQSAGLIHAWTGVTFADGQYQVTLLPKWWNDTTTAQLQMSIIDTEYSWDTSSPAGPVFTVDYAASAMYSTTTANGQVQTSTAAAAATQSQDAVFQSVSSTGNESKGISKGAIAAAVVVPLIVLSIVAAVAVRFWRAREAEKRRRWSQALSTHSGLEWEKGALPGDKPQSILGRPSMGGRSSMGGRPSMSSYGGNGRPTSSVYAVENNMAGAGAGAARHLQRISINGLRSHSADNVSSQARSSVVMPDGHVRQSRISFAETARPDRRSRLSFGGDIRANVQSGVFRLPGGSRSATDVSTPNRKSVAYATGSALDDDEEDINISPSQLQGPHGFADADMKRAAHGNRTGRRSMLSFGGDKRRESTASALSADDFKTAASARGSVDELRDMEAIMLMRRSMISQGTSSPNPNYSPNPAALADAEEVEALDNDAPAHALPSAPSPIAGASTVAYGPDQMLAVYAARGKVSSPTPMSPPSGTAPLASGVAPPKPTATRQNSGMRLLTNLGKGNKTAVAGEGSDSSMPPPPAPVDMISYVHLNKGTVSSAVVDALPAPGPRGVTSPTGERPVLSVPNGTTRASGVSDGSRYSQEVVDDSVGEAK